MDKGVALITSGELRNKGAQAMNFIAVSEVKRRFPGLEPVVMSASDVAPALSDAVNGRKKRSDLDNLDFKIVYPIGP